MMLMIGDTVRNTTANRIGSVRGTHDGMVVVRTVKGLETWAIADCVIIGD